MDKHYLAHLLEMYPVEHFRSRLSEVVAVSDAKKLGARKQYEKNRQRRSRDSEHR